ncbi:MAG: hypothetical protein ACRDQ1_02420 [Sciscionella sp.]
MTDEDVARGLSDGAGIYAALCGHHVTPGSLLMPPGTRCTQCRMVLRARSSLRSAQQRFAPDRNRHPSRCWRVARYWLAPILALSWSRRGAPLARHSAGDRVMIPVGAGGASPPTTPALTGVHTTRNTR